MFGPLRSLVNGEAAPKQLLGLVEAALRQVNRSQPAQGRCKFRARLAVVFAGDRNCALGDRQRLSIPTLAVKLTDLSDQPAQLLLVLPHVGQEPVQIGLSLGVPRTGQDDESHQRDRRQLPWKHRHATPSAIASNTATATVHISCVTSKLAALGTSSPRPYAGDFVR